MSEEKEAIPVVISTIEKEGSDTVPASAYVNREKLIQQYWLKKKMEKVSNGLLGSEFDRLYKAECIAEAEVLYPKKGIYIVTAEGVKYLDKI